MNTVTNAGNCRGYTLLEVLIALFISGLVIAASFQFFTKVSHQSGVQYDVSEMQNLCRVSMYEMRTSLRSAGYMLAGHPPYKINGDSLSVYHAGTQPVDTTLYFLEEYSDSAYQSIPGLPAGMILYYLMKQTNSDPPAICADFVSNMSFTQINSSNILVSITTQVPRGDDTYSENDGFRTFSLTERVNMRNVN